MILNKRILRDLKQNIVRYFAVFVVVAISMYVVVGMAGSAETVINGVKTHAALNAVQDGQFTLFVPLTVGQTHNIETSGIVLEKHFFIDFAVQNSTLRIFENREIIDLFEPDDGRCATSADEIALEKNYCRANNISIGDAIVIADNQFKVVGIGSTPDYNDVLQNITDASANPLLFGTAFVNQDGYDTLLNSSKALSAESMQYAYHLNGNISQDDFFAELNKFEFNINDINDKYAYDYFSKSEDIKNDLVDSIREVADASSKIVDSSNNLSSYANELSESVLPFGNVSNDVVDASEKLQNSSDELSTSANKLADETKNLGEAFNNFSNEYLNFAYSNLREFVKSDDNPRINASSDDIQVNKIGALIAGVIILILLAYLLSTFVAKTIDSESKVIGTLYSLGFVKKELIIHYLILPVMICFLGGLIGTITGFLSIGSQILENSRYFSYPDLSYTYSPYLIVYGIVVPFVMALVVNILYINKKLSKEPLTLIKKQQESYNITKIDLGKIKFINRFRIKLFIRELKSNLTIAIGMFISLLLVMLAFCIYSALTTIVTETDNDVKFNYMYYLSYPDDIEYRDAEKAYMKKLSKQILGYDFDVSILGIETDSNAFPYDIQTKNDEVYISTSVAEKYAIAIGDEFVLNDNINNVSYKFTVKGIVSYAPGLSVFMSIDEMRDRFDQKDDYYNVLISENPLNIESGRIYSTTTGEELREASKIFMILMEKLIYVLIAASVILFVLVMYLMVKMIIERQTNNISMFKVFGYKESEISKLYLRNNLYTVLASAVIFVPLSRWIIVKIYPYLVANRAVGFNLSFSSEIYLFIFGLIICSYIIAFILAKFKLNRISIQEILKDRE